MRLRPFTLSAIDHMDALLGYSGVVGSTLRENLDPGTTAYFNRTNFDSISGRKFRDVYCACIPGLKWWANAHPIEDEENVVKILATIKTIACERFILISTIDVHDMKYMYQTEDCEKTTREVYGYHRKFVEDSLRDHFGLRLYIFRLPAYFGIGMNKNILHDLIHRKNAEKINMNTCLQWYCLWWLSEDIREGLLEERPVSNLYSETIETKDIIEKFFPEYLNIVPYGREVFHNHVSKFGLKSRNEIFQSMENYIRVVNYTENPNRMVISNMAWNPEHDFHAIFLMKRYGIRNVEILPNKYGSWDNLFSEKSLIPKFAQIFKDNGIDVYSLQSVLHGVAGDFSTNHVEIANHLEKVMDLCRRVGGSVIVVGSPQQRCVRNSGKMIADVLSAVQCGNDIKVCLEPNASEYGCKVGKNLDECSSIVDVAKSDSVDGIGFYLNFDTGNRILEDDRLPRNSDHIGHCQVSAPFLRGILNWNYDAFEKDGTLNFFRWMDDDIRVSLEVSQIPIMNLGNQIMRFVNFMSK